MKSCVYCVTEGLAGSDQVCVGCQWNRKNPQREPEMNEFNSVEEIAAFCSYTSNTPFMGVGPVGATRDQMSKMVSDVTGEQLKAANQVIVKEINQAIKKVVFLHDAFFHGCFGLEFKAAPEELRKSLRKILVLRHDLKRVHHPFEVDTDSLDIIGKEALMKLVLHPDRPEWAYWAAPFDDEECLRSDQGHWWAHVV